MCQLIYIIYIILIILLLYLIIDCSYNKVCNTRPTYKEGYENSENFCKNKYGDYTYNRCIAGGGNHNACKSCDFCICVSKSGDVNRCASDNLFKDCMYHNKKMNNYKASKNCGLIKKGIPCKCISCYSHNPITSENLQCNVMQKQCNTTNKACYYKTKNKKTQGSCNCEEGLLVSSMESKFNNCECQPISSNDTNTNADIANVISIISGATNNNDSDSIHEASDIAKATKLLI